MKFTKAQINGLLDWIFYGAILYMVLGLAASAYHHRQVTQILKATGNQNIQIIDLNIKCPEGFSNPTTFTASKNGGVRSGVICFATGGQYVISYAN